MNNSTGYDQPLLCEWDFDNDGTVDSFVDAPLYSYINTSTYTIKLKVTYLDGSSDTIIKTDCVTVEAAGCQTLPVRTEGAEPLTFSAIQSAYDAAHDNDTLLVRAGAFTDSLTLDRPVSLTFKSGYDCAYGISDGLTTLNGNVVISDGVLVISDGTIEVQ